jgi:hypothetical protein
MVKRIIVDVILRQRLFDIDYSNFILPLIQEELIKRGVVVDDKLVINQQEEE